MPIIKYTNKHPLHPLPFPAPPHFFCFSFVMPKNILQQIKALAFPSNLNDVEVVALPIGDEVGTAEIKRILDNQQGIPTLCTAARLEELLDGPPASFFGGAELYADARKIAGRDDEAHCA